MVRKSFFSKHRLVLAFAILVFFVSVGAYFDRRLEPNIKHRFYAWFNNRQYKSSIANVLPGSPTTNKLLGYNLAGKKALLPGAKWVPQTFNNCGPATTSMVLQYFGHEVSQVDTKLALRSNPTDSNVFSYEIGDYLKKSYGIESRLMINGSIEMLKTLIANGFYIVVEDWLHPNEDIGHVTILRGFDDDKGVFISDDSYIGVNITYKYQEFDETQWKPFNREYMSVYLKEKEGVLKAIVGENWDQRKMYENAVDRSNQAISKNQNDMYSWFNLGTSYFGLKNYEKAKLAFERSRAIGWPRRMLWYQIEPVQTYNMLGEHSKALELAMIGLTANDSFAELHLESAIAYKGLGDLDKARESIDRVRFFAPNLLSQEELDSRFGWY